MFKAVSTPLPDLKDWRFSVDQWGIAWAVFDREGESQNSLGRRPLEELGAIVEEVEEGAAPATIRGLVISSGKERGFIVGADIREFADLTTEMDVIDKLRPVNALFDRIERLPVPVVCAINGFCLGGGLELALACHYRIATRDPGTQLGFPEVKLGIFPGFNGTARSIRQAGAAGRHAGDADRQRCSVGFRRARHRPRRRARQQPRRAPVGRAQGGPAQAQVEAGAAAPRPSSRCGRPAASSPRACASETKKKAREDHYPAPFRLIDLFERYGGNEEAHEGGRDARVRAADGVGPVARTCAACSGCRSC